MIHFNRGDHSAPLALATALDRTDSRKGMPSDAGLVLRALLDGAGASTWLLTHSRPLRGKNNVRLGLEERPFAHMERGEALGAFLRARMCNRGWGLHCTR